MEKVCRFCFEEGDINDLCCPCNCKGSQKWIHGKCILKYVILNNKSECPTCKYGFVEEQNEEQVENVNGILQWHILKDDLSYFWNEYFENLFSTRLWLSIGFFIGEAFNVIRPSRDL